jgi:hypothetical protein
MSWRGEHRDEIPLSLRLIDSARDLWLYVIRGQEIPRTKIVELRKQTQFEDKDVSRKLQSELRQLIGELALDGKLDVNGQAIGPFIMGLLCWPYDKNRRTLEAVLDLKKILSFTLGGYNLKEMTALAKRGQEWLEEMRGHNTPEQIKNRRRVEEGLENLLELIATARPENYEELEKERLNRRMTSAIVGLNDELLRKQNAEEILAETDHLNNRIAESWAFLRRMTPLDSPETEDLQRRIDLYQIELKKLDGRITKRDAARKRQAEKSGILNQRPPMSDEEQKWKAETESELLALRIRLHNLLYGTLLQQVMPEINSILSARNQLAWLRDEIEV